MEEIKDMVSIEKKNKLEIKSRYFVKNLDTTYLDIPILDNFFTYGFNLSSVQNLYSEIIFELNTYLTLDIVKEMVDEISIVPDKTIFLATKMRIRAMKIESNYLCLESKYHLHDHYCGMHNINMTIPQGFLKFIFIIQRLPEGDYELMNLPNLEYMEIDIEKSNMGLRESTLRYELGNMEIIDFQKFRVYLVAANPESNMKDWIKYQKESKTQEEIDKMILSQDNSINNNNVNSLIVDKYTPFSCIKDATNYRILFGPNDIDYQLEIYFIYQNQYKIVDGMIGKCFYS